MNRFYDSLFYDLYCWSIFVNKNVPPRDDYYHAVSAILMLSTNILLNVMSVIGMVVFVFKFVTWSHHIQRWHGVVLAVFVLGINYIYFISRSRYRKIVIERKNENAQEKRRKALFYLLGSLGSFFGIGVVGWIMR